MNVVIFIILLCSFKFNVGSEYKKQRNNPNLDFLAHEAAGGGSSVWARNDLVAPSNDNIQNTQLKQDYDSQFPALGSASVNHPSPGTGTTSRTTLGTQTSLRDYVAPQLPTQKHKDPQFPALGGPSINNPSSGVGTISRSQTGLRDYVAPQIPSQTHKTTQNSKVTPQPFLNHASNNNNMPTGKRDYVNPQFPTLRPLQENSGKVKDLINFYDGKSKDQHSPQNVPSFSSILQGNKQTSTAAHSGLTQHVFPTTPLSTMAGSNNKIISTVTTTPRPSLRNTPSRQGNRQNVTPRPGSLVVPSSIVNNNRNSSKGNNNNNSPTDAEIQSLSEELLRKDSNNAAKYITINYQEKTTSQTKEDKAPLPLLTIMPVAWNIPTVQKLVPLLDNYERDTLINEHVTAQERNEENAFMDVIMNTAVIRHLMTFLKEKGYISPDPKEQRDFLKQLWFNLYSRGKGKISSSGFEHVFVSEFKNGDVQGLHNWIYFSREEAANRANYLGYLKYQPLGDKGAVLKLHFNQQGVDKPVDTMFIGTSPELEIALYTLCFVTRPDNDCQLKLSTKDINIITHTFRYRSKNYIGSAYPQI